MWEGEVGGESGGSGSTEYFRARKLRGAAAVAFTAGEFLIGRLMQGTLLYALVTLGFGDRRSSVGCFPVDPAAQFYA